MTKLQIIVVGSTGRLGGHMSAELTVAGHQVVPLTRADLDITVVEQVSRVISSLQPDVIVNCTGYNAVDSAETDRDSAFAVNATGPSFLAEAARQVDALLIHFSSDFVFDGAALDSYGENDLANPLSVYGASKLAGELEVGAYEKHYILRVESLFGGASHRQQRATVDYIIDTLLAGRSVRAFIDRTVSPSYVPDVTAATQSLLSRGAPYGVYHCVNSGCTTWYELATEIRKRLNVGHIEPCSVESFAPAAARRPKFCALSNQKLLRLGVHIPTWQSAVARHVMGRLGTDWSSR